jgi:hypothetical protein
VVSDSLQGGQHAFFGALLTDVIVRALPGGLFIHHVAHRDSP